MRALTICCSVAILTGCAKVEQKPAVDSTAMQPVAAPAAPAPAPISLASVAGKWNMRTMAAGSDSVLVSYTMVATGDSAGWVFNFPRRPPVPVHIIAVEGDSIVTEAGPYESVLRKGVKVRTHSVMRLQDGKLVGATVARYTTTGPDSLRNMRTEGTRAP